MTVPSRFFAAFTLLASGLTAFAAGPTCQVQSGATLTPVIELYTSEGCSSCPPADRWLSTLKDSAAQGKAVVEAFHVGYWDSIGWVDRFASPAHTTRQKQVAGSNGLSGIYTPQVVRNGRDWRDFTRPAVTSEAARARIAILRGLLDGDRARPQQQGQGRRECRRIPAARLRGAPVRSGRRLSGTGPAGVACGARRGRPCEAGQPGRVRQGIRQALAGPQPRLLKVSRTGPGRHPAGPSRSAAS
jgi:hypothetical protein